MEKFEGVSNTLFIPLVARISISKSFPEYFYDEKSLELEKYLPEDAAKGSSQYSDMASTARYYNMDRMVRDYTKDKKECNVVYLGAGLETAYDRMNKDLPQVNWYEVDLPEVIKARIQIFGERTKEKVIAGDMFKMEWSQIISKDIPTLLIISGVFQYFHEEEVISFIKKCKEEFPGVDIIFDSTSTSGLRFTNWFVKRTGNKTALMYFGIDDCEAFAKKCEMKLVEEKTFFKEALDMLKKKVNIVTKVSMIIAEKKKQVLILHLKQV